MILSCHCLVMFPNDLKSKARLFWNKWNVLYIYPFDAHMAKFGPNQVCVSECNVHFPKKTYGRKILLVTQFKLASFLPRAVQVVPFLSWHKFTLCWVSITTACRWNMNFFWHKYKAARITVTRFFLVVGQISHDLDNKRCLQLLLWIYLEVLFNLSGEVEQE